MLLKLTFSMLGTGGPSSLHERGRDSCLRAVLCYKRLFTKACMGCKQFFVKERKNVMPCSLKHSDKWPGILK